MKFIIEEFAFKDSNGVYLDFVRHDDYMVIKLPKSTNVEEFSFTTDEWKMMKKRIEEVFKQKL